MRKLDLVPAGGNYKLIKSLIERDNLDISHFKGRAWNKGLSMPQEPKDVGLYFNNLTPITSYRLKQRLLNDKFLDRQCSRCGLTEWMNQPIPLELDHIDGDPKNNAFENLRVLCPNCHAFTPTYRGRNKSRRDVA